MTPTGDATPDNFSNIILPSEIICNSPSLQDGISHEDEITHRIFGCEIVQESGILLQMPQVVIALIAQNLLHRFFYRKSLKRFDAFSVAMATMLLATKVEEKPVIIREVAIANISLVSF